MRRTAFGLQRHHVVLAGFASPGEMHSAFDAITSFFPPGHDEGQPPEFHDLRGLAGAAAPWWVAKRGADPWMMRIERGDGDLADIAGSDGIAGQ